MYVLTDIKTGQSKKVELNDYISKHIKLYEFISRDLVEVEGSVILYNSDLFKLFELVRNDLNVPIYIESGFRSIPHNKKIGGKSNSTHLAGSAMDIYALDVKQEVLIDTFRYYALLLDFEIYIYKITERNIHVDVRVRLEER